MDNSSNESNASAAQIIFDQASAEYIDSWLDKHAYSSLFILVDENSFKCCFPLLAKDSRHLLLAHILEVEPGEASKSIEVAQGLLETLMDEGADRQSILINLGGGVVSDLGGFIASIYMRGIRTINIPTTLLAMTDATVGGKTGINFSGKKNIIGTFYQPELIIIQQRFLITLPPEELISGFAEVIKHALIEGGHWWNSFMQIEPLHVIDWSIHIQKSIDLKSKIVDEDAFEKGPRQKLNLGHTVAHALESYFINSEKHLFHGVAVAAGILIEAYLSNLEGVLTNQDLLLDLESYVFRHFPLVEFPINQRNDLIDYMRSDKKNNDGNIKFSFLKSPGEIIIGCKSPDANIHKALEIYLKHGQRN